MATRYVRTTTGSDSNGGTSPSDAWLTVGKALGATGIASGDTVWVGPGTYRELVNVQMTSATAETFVNADVDGSHTGDAPGPVIVSAFTTDDDTAPSATNSLIRMQGRDFLTFQDFWFFGANAGNGIVDGTTAVSTNITFRRCYLVPPGTRGGRIVVLSAAADTNMAWLFDSCVEVHWGSTMHTITLPTSASADYDANIKWQNCTILSFGGSGSPCFNIATSGAGAFFGGGVRLYDSLVWHAGGELFYTNSASLSVASGKTCEVKRCFLVSGTAVALRANTSGQLIEDENYIIAATPRTNVTTGSGSFVESKMTGVAIGPELALLGAMVRPFGTPIAGSKLLARSASGGPSTDGVGRPRPAGGNSASTSWGPLERHDTGTRDTTIARTSGNSLRITGPGDHEFKVPVDNIATSFSIYARYDSASYGGGTKPQLVWVADGEIGVTVQTATATAAAADAWEQITVSATPSNPGIATVRLVSNAAASGFCNFDDFAST